MTIGKSGTNRLRAWQDGFVSGLRKVMLLERKRAADAQWCLTEHKTLLLRTIALLNACNAFERCSAFSLGSNPRKSEQSSFDKYSAI